MELLKCPFCGEKPIRKVENDILSITCPNCVSVGFHNHVRFGCRADSEWNTRITEKYSQDNVK
jgi:sarcosine oxidase delta subunit